MCEWQKRPARGSWHRAQGKTSAQADVIDDPYHAPSALSRLYVRRSELPVESATPTREARIQQGEDEGIAD
jgi:hypothetical protein